MQRNGAGEETFDVGGRGKRDVQLRGVGVLAKQRMEVAGVFREDEADDVVTGEKLFAAPFADEEGDGVNFAGGVVGEELCIFQDNGDFEAGLRLAATLACDGSEIGAVTEENGDEFDGAARVFSGGAGAVVPLGEEFSAAFDAEAIADVVAENDVEARDDAVADQFGECVEIVLIGGREEIVRISGDDELVAGMAVVEIDNAINP